MNVYFSVEESLKYWRSTAPYYAGELVVAPISSSRLVNVSSSARQINEWKGILLSKDDPLEILVPSNAFHAKTKSLVTRTVAVDLPERSFFKKSDNVFVCCPELLFLLAAASYTLHELIALGYELCGTYSPTEEDPGLFAHAALTDVETIGGYLDSVKGVHGIKKARRALCYVRDGSASPRETDAHMMLCLPRSLGGFGLAGATLNTPIEVVGKACDITNMRRITPDLYWKAHRIVIEYESTEWHGLYASGRVPEKDAKFLNKTKLMDDSVRRRTFEAMGMTVITLTNGEFVEYEEVERIARLITRRSYLRFSGNRKAEERRRDLHEWIKVPVLKRKKGFVLPSA